ncbi:MAG: substrate-binding domain-containing protein [Victivallales bacterium]|jgi:DNA-binding LacI/PurR family transcriptional regulator|nr:substrate-binding domain-containing protein [Victivallales bacterium]
MGRDVDYKQGDIIAELKRRISAGVYSSCVPTGATLAAEFKVNIKTINKALNELVESGCINRKRGVGTFVSSHATDNRQIEVLFEGYSDLFEHPFWGKFWNGCIPGLLDAQYRPVLTQLHADKTGKLLLDDFQFSPSAGKLLLGITQKDFIELVRRQGVPVVSMGDEVNDPEFPQVCFNCDPGIHSAISFLVKKGCRRIAFIGETHNDFNPKVLNKFDAYRRALESFNIFDPELAEHARPLPESVAVALPRLLERTCFDAIFVAGDHQVPYVEITLKERNISIPIVGCDGLEFATWPTVALPRRAAGEAAAQMLIKLIKKEPTQLRVALPTQFIF